MCGHVGFLGERLTVKYEDAIKDGLTVCQLRGIDSVGAAVVPYNRNVPPLISKRIGKPPMYGLVVPTGGAKAIIGHTRSATLGSSSDPTLAHPFEFDNIYGAHNGTLRGDWRGSLEDCTNEHFGSDSEAIFYNFAYRGVRETIESIYGAWCLVWWDNDEQTLNMLRNNERPLWLATGESGNVYWASEHWMIHAMLRDGEKDRDKLVRTPTADGKEERFFHKLPVNQWRSYRVMADGKFVMDEDVELIGKTEPVYESSVLGSNYNDYYYGLWDGGSWVEADGPGESVLRLSGEYYRGSKNLSGKLYRVVAGEAYVSSPETGNECRFKDFIEYRTDGNCACCGEMIQHPADIGAIGGELDWAICRDCDAQWGDTFRDCQMTWADAMDKTYDDGEEESALFTDIKQDNEQDDDLPFEKGDTDDKIAKEVVPPAILATPVIVPQPPKIELGIRRPETKAWDWFKRANN